MTHFPATFTTAFLAVLCIGVAASTQESHQHTKLEANSHELLDTAAAQTSVSVFADGIVSKRAHASSVIRSDAEFRHSHEEVHSDTAAASSAAIVTSSGGGTVKGKVIFTVPAGGSAAIIASDDAKGSVSSIVAQAGKVKPADIVVEMSAGSSSLFQSLLESTAVAGVSGEAAHIATHSRGASKESADTAEPVDASFTITVPSDVTAADVVTGITDMSHHKFGEELQAGLSKVHLAATGLAVTDLQAAVEVAVKSRARTEVLGIGSAALAAVAIASHYI